MSFPPPESGSDAPERTDFASLVTAPVTAQPKRRKQARTDFKSLGGGVKRARLVRRTATDLLLDALTPALIFTMVASVVFFLLDVRYVFTAVHDSNMRVVAFCFIMGVVALNRLIARDGSDESMVYMFGLAGAIGMYTLATTSMYGVGSVSRNFMNDNPWLATGFNMVIVVFIWWLVNRLTHECCVDENRTAGDIGILRGTAKRIQRAVQRDPDAAEASLARPRGWNTDTATVEASGPIYGLGAFDPTTDHAPQKTKRAPVLAPAQRLARRHPGVSIFYFSIPALFIFSIGLAVVRHGGDRWVLAGMFYMGVYCVSALMLLMLTSLGGLRQYFRARNISIPAGIGPFWIGLGSIMVAMVLLAALQMPLPELPPLAYIDEHVVDPWAIDQFSLTMTDPISISEGVVQKTQRTLDVIGKGVLILFVVFLVYAVLRFAGSLAARIARNRDRYPQLVRRIFDALDRLLMRLMRLPSLPSRIRRTRVSRNIATCVRYRNSLGDPEISQRMTVSEHVAYAYEALCALAYDLAVPRRDGQTPYEFIAAFPRELTGLREEARELTDLYVFSAYSPEQLDMRVTDRLRKFWITYNRVRNRCLR